MLIRARSSEPIGGFPSATISLLLAQLARPPSSSTSVSPATPPIVCDGEHPLRRPRHPRPHTSTPPSHQGLALGMAKLNPPTTPPSSIRFLRNLSAISRTPTPSCAILAVLASLVASVNPFPVGCHESNDPPPSFLCPSLEPQAEFDVQEFVLPTQTPPPTPSVPGPSGINRANIPTPVRRRVRRNLAPGYTQGEDGRWRKLSTWSLYGSTICVVRGFLIFDSCPTRSLLPVS